MLRGQGRQRRLLRLLRACGPLVRVDTAVAAGGREGHRRHHSPLHEVQQAGGLVEKCSLGGVRHKGDSRVLGDDIRTLPLGDGPPAVGGGIFRNIGHG